MAYRNHNSTYSRDRFPVVIVSNIQRNVLTNNLCWKYYYLLSHKNNEGNSVQHTHRTLLWITAVIDASACLVDGEICRKIIILRPFLMVVAGYSFSLLRITTLYLLVIIPDGIVIDNETHEEKWRHCSIKDDFPGSNLKERIHVSLPIRRHFKAKGTSYCHI